MRTGLVHGGGVALGRPPPCWRSAPIKELSLDDGRDDVNR
jgi:hypothetical protein